MLTVRNTEVRNNDTFKLLQIASRFKLHVGGFQIFYEHFIKRNRYFEVRSHRDRVESKFLWVPTFTGTKQWARTKLLFTFNVISAAWCFYYRATNTASIKILRNFMLHFCKSIWRNRHRIKIYFSYVIDELCIIRIPCYLSFVDTTKELSIGIKMIKQVYMQKV